MEFLVSRRHALLGLSAAAVAAKSKLVRAAPAPIAAGTINLRTFFLVVEWQRVSVRLFDQHTESAYVVPHLGSFPRCGVPRNDAASTLTRIISMEAPIETAYLIHRSTFNSRSMPADAANPLAVSDTLCAEDNFSTRVSLSPWLPIEHYIAETNPILPETIRGRQVMFFRAATQPESGGCRDWDFKAHLAIANGNDDDDANLYAFAEARGRRDAAWLEVARRHDPQFLLVIDQLYERLRHAPARYVFRRQPFWVKLGPELTANLSNPQQLILRNPHRTAAYLGPFDRQGGLSVSC